MATEDFSFPTTADLFPCGIDSPPLWRLSPAASPDVFLDRKSKQEEEEEDCFVDVVADKDDDQERKSLEKSKKAVDDSELEDDDEEEKMDLLWEDFNEELAATSGSSKSSGALKLSKTNGNAGSAMFAPARRPAGMLVFMRVLRKLFLLHNSHRSLNHRTWQTP